MGSPECEHLLLRSTLSQACALPSKASVELYIKEAPRVFNVSTFPGVSKPQWSLLFQTPVPGRNHTCILFIFHEGQARLQLLVPPLPALGCAVFGLLEEEAASWPGQLGTFQASETLVLGPRDIQTGLVTCVAALSTWLCTGLTSRNGNTHSPNPT